MSLPTLALVLIAALVLSWLLTALTRRYALSTKLIDRVSNEALGSDCSIRYEPLVKMNWSGKIPEYAPLFGSALFPFL